MSKLSERRKQIREFTTGEAEQELERLRRQLFDLRIQKERGEVKNNRQFTQVRTDIARLIYQLDLLEQVEEEEALGEEEEAVKEEEEEAVEEAQEEAESEAEQEEAPTEKAASDAEEADEAAPAEEEEVEE